jgi:Mg-chelatase subunit ChlD
MSMPSAPAHRPTEEPPARRWRWQLALPAWLVSLVIHALFVIVLGYVASQQLHGTNAPANTSLIASYASSRLEEDYFEDEQSVEIAGGESSSDSSGKESDDQSGAKGGLTAIANGPPPVDAGAALPSTELAAANPGEAMTGTATGAGSFGSGPRRPAAIRGKRARTSIYGVAGEGNTFAYVFDRSSSMGTGANSLLASAKRELLASLDELGDENRFQIIFYNQKPTIMDLGRAYAGLVFADARSKELARRFVESMMADGATDHFDALKKALRLGPDVIFFLTDADEPALSDVKLRQLRNLNAGRTAINTIEFGEGAQPGRENFLARIARENGGQYVYIDIRRLAKFDTAAGAP